MSKKERVAISIDRDILKKVDSMVDGVDVRSRSHALDLLLRRSMNMQQITHALIFAGERGSTLEPFGSQCKFLVKIRGRTLIERMVDWLRSFGITDLTIAVSRFASQIEDQLGDGSAMGVKIRYQVDEEPIGTAGVLWRARRHFTEPFIAMNGDTVAQFNLLDMVRMHVENSKGKLATLAVREVPNPHRYGVVLMDGHAIREFIEKPRLGSVQSSLINAGIYIFEPDIFQHLPREGRLGSEVLPKLAARGALNGYLFSGPWIHVDSPESLKKASELCF